MYKKRLISVVLLLSLLFITCYTVKVVAPPGKNVQLLSESETTTFKTTKRAIYLIGGLIPIANTQTDETIAKYELQNVRVKTEFDIIDWLISGITGGLVVTKSVTIEGTPGTSK
ncbi:MAG: hypothetical protein ABIK33_03795 [candidate division WOR-3 bacterium]